MQKICVVVLALFLGLTSCDNELQLTAPWKDIPVVYGVISPADTAHYIRIEKAFLDPQRSALEIARIPDSLYYNELQADLVNLGTDDRIALTEVNATNEGYPRNDGVFATEPNILYKVTAAEAQLQAGQRYRLEIKRSETLPLVTAETSIVARPVIVTPQPSSSLNFKTNGFFKTQWLSAEGAAFYDVILYVHYGEYYLQDPSNVTEQTVAWKLGGVITSTEIQVPGEEFYKFLRSAIPADPQIRRIFRGIDVQVRAGGAELYEFQRVQLSNTGITSAGGDLPQYTNLSEGVGLFSSANRMALLGLNLHPQSQDSLINGSYTKDLNFL